VWVGVSSCLAKQVLLLDACVLINLEATSQFDEIARGLRADFFVVRQASREVGSLRADVNGLVRAVPIDLARHVAAGTLTMVDLTPAELALYVDLASELGDGEAASIAVALNRDLAVATDDHKARRICVERGLPEPIRTTDILREYCDRSPLAADAVREVLHRIRDLASFVPARSDPNQKWWTSYIE
jgi:predicted nucleic acid-binding protein